MRVDGHDVEVDEYAGALDGLVVAEVEFIDEESARGVRAAGVVRPRAHRRSRLREPQPRDVRPARRQARLSASPAPAVACAGRDRRSDLPRRRSPTASRPAANLAHS